MYQNNKRYYYAKNIEVNMTQPRERERVNIARKWLLNFNSISSMQKKRAA